MNINKWIYQILITLLEQRWQSVKLRQLRVGSADFVNYIIWVSANVSLFAADSSSMSDDGIFKTDSAINLDLRMKLMNVVADKSTIKHAWRVQVSHWQFMRITIYDFRETINKKYRRYILIKLLTFISRAIKPRDAPLLCQIEMWLEKVKVEVTWKLFSCKTAKSAYQKFLKYLSSFIWKLIGLERHRDEGFIKSIDSILFFKNCSQLKIFFKSWRDVKHSQIFSIMTNLNLTQSTFNVVIHQNKF